MSQLHLSANDDEEESMADLVARAAAEQEAERQASAEADLERQMKVKKAREDKEYERYWNRVTGKSDANDMKGKSLSKSQMTQREYYSMTKRMGDKNSLNKMNNLKEKYASKGFEEMDFEAVPRRPGEQGSNLPAYLGVGVGIAALAAGSASFNRNGGSSSEVNAGVISSDTTKFSSRLIKKDFQIQDLQNNAVKSMLSVASLPDFPVDILRSLHVLRGEVPVNVEQTVVIFWRPSSLLSLRTVSAFNNNFAQALEKAGTKVINVLVPKYTCEFDLQTTDSLLSPSQIGGEGSIIVLDRDRKLWGKLGINKWPTVLVNNKNKILFALEGSRSFSEVAGRAAIAGAFASNSNASLENLVSAYSSNPMLPSSSLLAERTQLNKPSRVTVDKKTGDLIISDTGNNRVLIVDKNTFTVKRVLGKHVFITLRLHIILHIIWSLFPTSFVFVSLCFSRSCFCRI